MATQVRGGRNAILQGAVRLFTKVGYHGASVRDLAKECDVTVASIYYHFASKQEILQEIMVNVLTDVIKETREAVMEAGGDPNEQLGALMRTWVLFHTRRRAEALVGASEIRSLEEDGLRKVIALRDEQESIFRDVVDRGVQEGAFSTPNALEASRALIAMGRTVVDWYHVGGPTKPAVLAETYARLALSLVGSSKA